MERDFDTDEFEVFLQQKADQYKIYPGEKTWKNIYGVLHTRQRWFTIGGSLLALLGLFFIGHGLIFNVPFDKSIGAKSTSQSNKLLSEPPKFSSSSDNIIIQTPISPANTSTGSEVKLNKNNRLPTFPISNLLELSANLRGMPLATGTIKEETKAIDIYKTVVFNSTEAKGLTFQNIEADVPAVPAIIEEQTVAVQEVNWLQELAAIKLTPPKKSPFNIQFYFSPSISYRKLADNKNKSNINQQSPMAFGSLNIDKYVDHNPSIGAELGSNILFYVGRSLVLKSGLQLNYSRYNIKAYKSYFEKASIALNSVGPNADTLTSYTSFRNFNGNSPEQLQNQYLQISVPVGAEVKLIGNKRLQLNIAGTIQPTYLLFNDTYLLSTDYINYAKEPSLVRKWNVHTSVEAFLSYKTGGVRWQVGPQFRYQMMSSYTDRYPIKEYLMEYGIKVGISKTIR